MKRITLIGLLALLASVPAWAIPIVIDDYDYMSRFGVEHVNGPGTYQLEEGGTLPFVVKNTQTLAKALGIKGLKNGEHILLQHIKNDRFELRHEATGQKAAVRIPLKK